MMPEQIQSPSMTADWEEKLLMIERGEYDSNAFLKEIQDMISALVQTYEKVKGSDVLMAKEVQTVGVCPVCGSSVTERQKGFSVPKENAISLYGKTAVTSRASEKPDISGGTKALVQWRG